MQPITPALLAAARSWKAEPVVQALVEDRRVRWSTLHDWPGGPDTSPVAQFSNGSIILRAISDAAGRVRVARVWLASSPAAWEDWVTVADDARSGCDVAVSWIAPYTWIVLYEGAAGRLVQTRVSSDDGVSWSAPMALHTAWQTPWLAAWGAWAMVLEDRLHAYRWTGASWQGPFTLASSATPEPHGVAAYFDPGAQWAHVLYSSRGQLLKVELDARGTTPVYTTPRVLAPGGDQAGSLVAGVVLPSLTRVMDLGLVATWVERHRGELTGWGRPVSAIARDGNAQHFGQVCPLADSTVSAQRWHLAYDGVTKTLYAGNRRRIVTAPVFDADIRGWMRLGPVDVLSCRRVAERHEPGELTVELLDPAMAYRNPGDPNSDAVAIKPLAAVRLRRGYRTPQGIETVDTPNYYIMGATLSEGQGAGRLRIEAVDAFGLLSLWRPFESIEWYQRSIAWLLEEVCGRVGLRVEADGASALGEVLPRFSLHPHQSALAAVQALMRLGRVVARPAAGDTLRMMAYPLKQAARPELGAAGEVRQAAYGCARYRLTHVRVVSEAHDAYAEAESVLASQRLGMRISNVIEDNRVATPGMAAALAQYTLNLAASWGRDDEATVPLRPDLEVWDQVALHAAAEAIPADDRERVLVRLVEEAAPVRNRYVSVVTLGQAPRQP